MFDILKIINNNTVLVRKDECDYILLGKGIGFNLKTKKILESIPEGVKIFTPSETNPNKNYKQLLDEIDTNVIEAVSEIVLFAEDSLGKLDAGLFLVLCGHIDFAVKRMKESIIIEHPLIFEIEVLYSREYEVAKQAVKTLEQKLKMKIDNDEVGYIALHLNGARVDGGVKKALKTTNIFKLIVDEVERSFKTTITRNEIYLSFIDYFRALFYRLESGIKLKSLAPTNMIYSYEKYYQVAKKIALIIKNNTEFSVSEDEIIFMTTAIYQAVESSK